jgi:hypothetical protein
MDKSNYSPSICHSFVAPGGGITGMNTYCGCAIRQEALIHMLPQGSESFGPEFKLDC